MYDITNREGAQGTTRYRAGIWRDSGFTDMPTEIFTKELSKFP